MGEILKVEDLKVRFYTYEGIVKALEGVNLDVLEGETLGIVGETGSGKTVTSLSILVLIPPPGRIEEGKILFRRGKEFLDFLRNTQVMYQIRGKEISMVFQEPNAALNPVYTVGDQVSEVLVLHRRKEFLKKTVEEIEEELERGTGFKKFLLRIEKKIYSGMLKEQLPLALRFLLKVPILNRLGKSRFNKEVRNEVVNILREMGIGDPERVVDMYPHELSGGMQQRVVIAMALACNPKLLIADEPTTSLDVTVQAQILDLIRELKEKFKSSIIYVTHDMGVIAELCDRVAVMYAGTICEVANVLELFKNPLHPYTKALLESIPKPGKELKAIRGTVPNLVDPPSGCRFHPRCDYNMPICSKEKPELREIKKGHYVACHLYKR